MNQVSARDEVDHDLGSMSIRRFCELQNIAVVTFYRNRSSMPPTFRIGRRVCIRNVDVRHWLEAQAAPAK